MRIMLKSKIHRAQVTEANVNYVGSITVDRTLMEKADLLPGEKVLVVDNTNGNRLETYVLEGEADSGVICMNGGSARLVSPGDLITLLAFDVTDEINPPKKILVDENNKFLQYV
ncbi:MAG: aspartate 1-decarboxylase [Moorea sp. SIO4G2]|uniref:Aspartate 1-decarboxylase n=1 Tax=Moorena bouillonii PNG TaxID=568701 RepID=A0A1U7MXA9_9CYAN|nr:MULTISPECIES: aspartate 1-decarboxylase [Moorena]NEO46654.1 aspartate 1-decarboxylase [Moorena sp. SIO4A3]NEO60402.1 aspartate 1-decarboxylase [Moorena sp. SIO4G2]NEQ80202.1 aspartate 1-decarboxylase [Moorena sp. SIO2I5]NEO12912.1 aspartate 1-decarboxylase [Moorena sp. SIO3E8]NEO24336.1 aspartate 1-decarboxylase [Moorena sp. SIO4A5]